MKEQIAVAISEKDTIARRAQCTRKFLFYFPGGYTSKKFIAWERQYKWDAHLAWEEVLNKKAFIQLLEKQQYSTIAQHAIKIESKTNLLFSFEKMALRDAVKTAEPAKLFAEALFNYLYEKNPMRERFELFSETLSRLPVKQTRVLTWPMQTVFGFIAKPDEHLFLKPTVTKTAAAKYHFNFDYRPSPNWKTYESLLAFAALIRKNTDKWHPRDMIDLQSFIWVTGSTEYPD